MLRLPMLHEAWPVEAVAQRQGEREGERLRAIASRARQEGRHLRHRRLAVGEGRHVWARVEPAASKGNNQHGSAE